MKRKMARVLLIITLLALMALAACVDWGGGADYNATATYGAEQYHIQETAQWEVGR